MNVIITGITGQDGSYLTEQLLARGDTVHGIVRRTSSLERSRLKELYADPDIYNRRLFLHYADLDDITTIRRIIFKHRPEEFYHLAGQSHVGLSFEIPETTCEFTAMATLRILEILRDLDAPPRILHIGSSEIFGSATISPQNESTPMEPVTPYGCAKMFATQMIKIYRQHHGMFACNAIAYNHESPRRGEHFVTRKICRAAAEIKMGIRESITLGNLDARRDWSDARDIVDGYIRILSHHTADDFVLASGITHSVRDVVRIAFETVDLRWEDYVETNETFVRTTDPGNLCGDASKAASVLGWRPKNAFNSLIAEMTRAELELCQASPMAG